MEIFLDPSVWADNDFLSPALVRPLELDFLRLVRFGRAPFQQRRRGTAWTVRKLERCLFIVLIYLAFVKRTSGPSGHSKSILGLEVGPRCLQTTKKRLSDFVDFLRTQKKLNTQALVYALQALADYVNFVGYRADQLYPRRPDEDPVHLSSEHLDLRELGRTLPSRVSVYAEEQARQFGSLSIFKDYSKPKVDFLLEEEEALQAGAEFVDGTRGMKKNENRFQNLCTTEFAWLNSWQALLGAQVKALLGPVKEENKRWRLARPLEKDLKFEWMDWAEAVNVKVWKTWFPEKRSPTSREDAEFMVKKAALMVFASLPQSRASVLCGLKFGTTLVEKYMNGKMQFVIQIDRLSEHASRHKMWPKYLEEGVQYLLKPCFLLEDEHDFWYEFMVQLRNSNREYFSTDLVFPSLQNPTEKKEPFITTKLKEGLPNNLLENTLFYGQQNNALRKHPMTEQEMEENIRQFLVTLGFEEKFSSFKLFHFRKLAETVLRQFAVTGVESSKELWEPSRAEKFVTPKNAAAKTVTQNKLSLHKNTDPYIDFRSTNPLNARVVDTLSGMCKRILQQKGWEYTYDNIVKSPFLPHGSEKTFWQKFLKSEHQVPFYFQGPVSKPFKDGSDNVVRLAFWLNRTMVSDTKNPVDKFSIGLPEVLPKLVSVKTDKWVLVLSAYRVQWTWLCAILKLQGYLVENEAFSKNSPRIFVIVPTMQKRSAQRSRLLQKYSRQIKIFFVTGSRWHANSFSLFTPNFLRFSICSAALRPAPWSLQTETIWMQDFRPADTWGWSTLTRKWFTSSSALTTIGDNQAASALRASLDLYSVKNSHCWYTGWKRPNGGTPNSSEPLPLLRPAVKTLDKKAPYVLCLQVSANSNHQGRFTDQKVTTAFGLQEAEEKKAGEVRLYWPSKSQMHEATKFPGLALSAKQRQVLIKGAITGYMTQSLYTYKESAPSRKSFLPHCKLFALFEAKELETPEQEATQATGLPCLAVFVGSYTLSTQSWCVGGSGTNVEMGHFVKTLQNQPLRAIYDFENFNPSDEDVQSTVYAPLHFTPFSQPYTDPQNMFVS